MTRIMRALIATALCSLFAGFTLGALTMDDTADVSRLQAEVTEMEASRDRANTASMAATQRESDLARYFYGDRDAGAVAACLKVRVCEPDS